MCPVKVDHHLAALLLHINGYRRIRQADDNPALTIFTATEIDVAYAVIAVAAGARCNGSSLGQSAACVLDGKNNLVTVCMCLVRNHV